jgi:hypothetical protein
MDSADPATDLLTPLEALQFLIVEKGVSNEVVSEFAEMIVKQGLLAAKWFVHSEAQSGKCTPNAHALVASAVAEINEAWKAKRLDGVFPSHDKPDRPVTTEYKSREIDFAKGTAGKESLLLWRHDVLRLRGGTASHEPARAAADTKKAVDGSGVAKPGASKDTIKAFVSTYIKDEKSGGRRPHQRGVCAAWRAEKRKGHRDDLREEFKRQYGAARGRPQV